MAVDTPARIAILGGGPIALEAALYARYLGYDVDLYERGEAAQHVRDWGHVRMFSPWRMNASSLGIAALQAQDSAWQPPAPDALLTGQEYAEAYLAPLARCDLLVDSLREHCEVLALGKEGLLKGDLVGDEARGDYDFRLLVREANGAVRTAAADVVIDCTGTFGLANPLGSGGIPCPGESEAAAAIEHRLPDLAGGAAADYAGKRVLVVGSGYSAATNVLALAELALRDRSTHITWVTRQPPAAGEGPIPRIADDRLAERDRIARQASELALAAQGPVTWLAETSVDSIVPADGGWNVRLIGTGPREIVVDRIVANVGFRPDTGLWAELQVHECYASEGPMRLASALHAASRAADGTAATGEAASGGPVDCLDQAGHGPQSLMTTEPNFYVLGAKSYGRQSQFLISLGLAQIRDLFTIIADRAGLDLYATHAG